MGSAQTRQQINSLNNEIVRLEQKLADSARDEANKWRI